MVYDEQLIVDHFRRIDGKHGRRLDRIGQAGLGSREDPAAKGQRQNRGRNIGGRHGDEAVIPQDLAGESQVGEDQTTGP